MRSPYPPFIEQLRRTDPGFFELAARQCDLVMGPGALDPKSKALILLAVDAFAGSSGVAPLADQARRLGASEQEIAEALRIAAHVAGGTVLAAATAAFPPPVPADE